jgi:hypothetical protein
MHQPKPINLWRLLPTAKSANTEGLSHPGTWCGALLFVLIGLMLALALQSALLLGLKHYGEGNLGIMNRVMRGHIDADILISGSSRAMFHYDPRIIEAETNLKSFNIGRNGTKLHEQLELLQLYLRRNKPPAYLIQNLDMMSFEKNDEITDPKQYISWLDHDEVYAPLFQRKKYYLFYRWFPLLGMARSGAMQAAVLGLLKPSLAQTDKFKGYAPQYFTWNKDFEKFKAENPAGVKWTVDPQKVQTLTNLLEICKKNQIKVILVHSPEYLETGDFFLNRNEMLRQFRKIAQSFRVPFWDYSENPMCGNKGYFYNSQHLNHTGASIFSKFIARRLSVEIFSERKMAGSRLSAVFESNKQLPDSIREEREHDFGIT